MEDHKSFRFSTSTIVKYYLTGSQISTSKFQNDELFLNSYNQENLKIEDKAWKNFHKQKKKIETNIEIDTASAIYLLQIKRKLKPIQ